MVALVAEARTVSEDDVDAAFARANAALAEALSILASFDAQRGWERSGAASATAWLERRGHCTHAEAAVHVRNARLLRSHHEVEAAVQDGSITPSHLTQLSGLARHRSRRFTADVGTLVETATRLIPEDYRRVAVHWRALADDVLTAEERDERNYLDIAQTYAGSWIVRGVFDPVRGAALHTLLLERSGPQFADDHRSGSERRADALFEVISGGAPVQARVDVIVDVDTFVGRDRPLEDIRRELAGVGAIDRVLLERLACDPAVGRVLARGRSEILELGRRVRLASPAQRRAVIARDRGCAWPDCRRPSPMCEVHHLTPWQEGGASDLDNLVLLCGRHHARVHRGWRLRPDPDGGWEAAPP